MSSAKGKNFNCEECGKPTYNSDIGNYQVKREKEMTAMRHFWMRGIYNIINYNI